MGDAFLKNRVGFETDGVGVGRPPAHRCPVRRRRHPLGSSGAGPVPDNAQGHVNDGFQNVAPAVGAVDVAGAERTPFQIAELVEHEQGMIAGTPKMAVVGRALLVAMGRTGAAVHIKHDHLRRMPLMHSVYPLPGKIGKRGEIFLGGQNRLEAPHLTARGRLFRDSMAADDPSHDRVD